MKTKKIWPVWVGLFALIAIVVGLAIPWYQQRNWIWGTYDGKHFGAAPQRIKLTGTAVGGVVSLGQMNATFPYFASIQTTQGESAESVLKQLAAVINESDPFCVWSNRYVTRSHDRGSSGLAAVVEGTELIMPNGRRYIFSGTDRGFNIPKPAMSVSATYDPHEKLIMLSWINPSDQYDEIDAGGLILPAGTTSCTYDRAGMSANDIIPEWLGVVLRRGKTYSPPASILLGENSQQELGSFPFYMGVAPNWCAWSDRSDSDGIKFEQGVKSEVDLRGFVTKPDEKPFYQILKTTRGDVQGGIWRRFLGLVPHHTYKVHVRLNTLAMDASTNDWAFSLHAAYDNPGGTGLTTNQLAGAAALPDGSSGPSAGRVALYSPGTTTQERWVERSTDEPGGSLKKITLPKNVVSITVWLRHNAVNSTGVGMDWIKLEDITLMTK
jgi:hypothetical protein